MPTRNYSSVAVQTTLSGTINASTTTIIVASVTGFPSSFPYTLAIDYGSSSNELIDVNSAASTTLTVTRAVDGTSAQGHSSGAVVRHVSSGRDFAESRAHEASTAAHGATGAVVGTTNTQSMSNKTLTSPTLSGTVATGTSTFSGTPTFSGAVALSGGGSLAGTFTGTPTISGAAVFTGGPNFNSGAAGNAALNAAVTADTFDRFRLQADGGMNWGPGSGARDVTLYRSAADNLKTDDSFTVGADLKLANGTTVYRNQIAAAAITVANTTTETIIGTSTIPANDAIAGAVYRMTVYGMASTTGTPTITWRARLGGVAGTGLGTVGPITTSSAISSAPWKTEIYLRNITIGASATWSPMFLVNHNVGASAAVGMTASQLNQTVDSTVSQALVITVQWGTASASNTITGTATVFERVA